jgi:hypothetical protein
MEGGDIRRDGIPYLDLFKVEGEGVYDMT